MNKVILMGRLTRDPEIRYTQGENAMAVARFSLAVDRRRRSNSNSDEQTADFISCVSFGKLGEFAEKYLYQGTKIVLVGKIQTGSYTNKDGHKVYTTDVIADEIEFAESKAAQSNHSSSGSNNSGNSSAGDGFINIPDDVEDDGLPFN